MERFDALPATQFSITDQKHTRPRGWVLRVVRQLNLKREIMKTETKPHPAEGAHKMLNERKDIRPFNENQKKDGNYNYVHQTDAHQAVDQAWKEGVAWLASWLIEKEGEEISEELLQKWVGECIDESCPISQMINRVNPD